MRILLLTLLVLPSLFPAARAQDEEEEAPALQRHLVGLSLGDGLKKVRRVYPPAKEWTATVDPKTEVTRYHIERADAKAFPANVELLYLGFKNGRLAEIEVVYDEEKSRVQIVGKMAGEYSLIYGQGKKSDDRFWWSDGKTVLRVFPAEIPLAKDGAHAVAWRTAVQIFDRGLAARSD